MVDFRDILGQIINSMGGAGGQAAPGGMPMAQNAPSPSTPLPNFSFNPFATGPGVTNGMMMAIPVSQQIPAAQQLASVQQAPASGPYPGATGNALPPNTAMGGAGWPDGIAHKIAPADRAAAPPSDAVSQALQCVTANGPSNFVVSETSGWHPPGNPHTDGKAFDVTADPAYRAAIMQAAANCGAVYQQDEYVHPSPGSNGGHLHFQLRPGLGGAVGPYFPAPGPIAGPRK